MKREFQYMSIMTRYKKQSNQVMLGAYALNQDTILWYLYADDI